MGIEKKTIRVSTNLQTWRARVQRETQYTSYTNKCHNTTVLTNKIFCFKLLPDWSNIQCVALVKETPTKTHARTYDIHAFFFVRHILSAWPNDKTLNNIVFFLHKNIFLQIYMIDHDAYKTNVKQRKHILIKELPVISLRPYFIININVIKQNTFPNWRLYWNLETNNWI